MRKSLLALTLAGGALASSVAIPLAMVGAQEDPHPPCAGIRIQFGGGASFTVPAPPDGYVWVSFYSKAGDNPHRAQSATVGATWGSGEFNQNGQQLDISHVDGCKVLVPTTTTTTTVDTTSTTTTEATTSTTTSSIPDTSSTTTTTIPGSTSSTTTVPGSTSSTSTTEPTTTTPTTSTTVPGTTSSTTTTSPATTTTEPGSTPRLPLTR